MRTGCRRWGGGEGGGTSRPRGPLPRAWLSGYTRYVRACLPPALARSSGRAPGIPPRNPLWHRASSSTRGLLTPWDNACLGKTFLKNCLSYSKLENLGPSRRPSLLALWFCSRVLAGFSDPQSISLASGLLLFSFPSPSPHPGQTPCLQVISCPRGHRLSPLSSPWMELWGETGIADYPPPP